MRHTAQCKRCFLDIQDHINTNKDGYFPYTPPVNLLRGLRVAIDLLLEEGMENVFARHKRLASGVRAAIKAWGLKLAASSPKWQSDTVSAIWLEPGSKNNPNGKKAMEVISIAYHTYNISLGAGLTQVAGKVFRIGHLGDNNEARMMAALGAVEMAMIDAGIKFTPGSGTGAAAKYWTSNPNKALKKKKKK
jgi:alanine-glyoxylate transaminase/serine-glyoxylate transaminase/serine-pyruvate transaminase